MEDKVYNRLINLLKLFKNRPYHLAKYLIDNNSLSDDFLKKLMKNRSLDSPKLLPPHFNDISQMNQYFNSLIIDFDPDKVTEEELTIKLNRKLDELIKDELYEDAIRIRDYMVSRNIQRISNNF